MFFDTYIVKDIKGGRIMKKRLFAFLFALLANLLSFIAGSRLLMNLPI